jgi:division protein CdvB (Snf7/Vps24/ESCRT-III family)
MTDAQKIEALTDLLSTVINTLELTKYDIEDATESHNVVVKADAYHQQMIDILHGVPDEEVAQSTAA